MRRILGTPLTPTLLTVLLSVLLSALLLTGCSGDADVADPVGSTASDPVASESTSPEPTDEPADPESDGTESDGTESDGTESDGTESDGDAAGAVDYDVVALVSETAAGSRTSSMLTPLDTPNEIDTFVSQFRLERFADDVRMAASTSSYDGRLWAAVISVGCDVPPGVFVEEGEAGYLATPKKVIDPLPECLAAVTTVALVAIR